MYLRMQQDGPEPYPILPDGDPWQELANAVVYQAAADWRKAVRTLKHPPGQPGELQSEKILQAWRMWFECEEFFRSEWIHLLTGVDGMTILEKLKKEVNDL